ncbi:hypothetical protein [Absidia glauca]|uniref:Uncharacterized protein n=1 Tax=Absidia glauca TaxID=4829 RepID=A0A163JF46_ABSGL|nr:hypothetical protein [Absidia glauca]
MLGTIEPTSKYNTHAKTQVPKSPEPTPHIIFKLRQIAREPTYLSKLPIQHISPGNAPRPLILPLKQPAGAQFWTEPGNGTEYGARKYDMVIH